MLTRNWRAIYKYYRARRFCANVFRAYPFLPSRSLATHRLPLPPTFQWFGIWSGSPPKQRTGNFTSIWYQRGRRSFWPLKSTLRCGGSEQTHPIHRNWKRELPAFSIKLVLVIGGGFVTLVVLGRHRGVFSASGRHPDSNEDNAGFLNSQRCGFVVIIGYPPAWFTIR